MRKSSIVVAAGLVAGLLGAFATPAAAEITRSESYEFSASTSLKIVEPVGAHVFVTIGSETKEDTLPSIFTLPQADAYVNVKLVTKDGETWAGKVEIKAHHQTVLRFTQSGKPAAAPSAVAPVGKFIGKLVNNTDTCDWPENVQFEVVRDGTAVAQSGMVFPGRDKAITLERGQYSVRILNTTRQFLGAKPLNVTHDGWVMPSGCIKDN